MVEIRSRRSYFPDLISFGLILAILILSTVSGATNRDPVGSVAPSPDIDIVPDQSTFNITTEPGITPDVLAITGSVYCTIPDSIPPGTECRVQLIIQVYMGDGDLVPLMIFTNEVTKLEFSYNLEIMEAMRSGRTISILIYGNWEYDSVRGYGDVSSETVMVNIVQYASVEIENSYSSGIWELVVGESDTYFLKVYNNGNGDDTIHISIIGQPDDLNIEIETTYLVLGAFDQRDIQVEIEQTGGKARSGILTFECSSEVSGIQSSDTVDISYRSSEPVDDGPLNISFIIGGIVMVVFIGVGVVGIILIRKRSSPK